MPIGSLSELARLTPSPSVRPRTERWLHECAAAYRSGHGFETASLIKETVMPADAITMSWKGLTDKVKETPRTLLRGLSLEETARLAAWEDEGGTTSSRLPVPVQAS